MNQDIEKDAIAKDPTAIGAFRDDQEDLSNLKEDKSEKKATMDTLKVAEDMGDEKVMPLGEVEEGTASDSTIADPTILGPNRS